jgi:tripartite ATP-independent transporter DctP family solute receptor
MNAKSRNMTVFALACIILLALPGILFAKTKITLAHYMPASTEWSQHAAAIIFKSFIESQSEGEIEVNILPAGQVGNERSAMEQCQNNLIQMLLINDGAAVAFVPELQVFSLPYLFKSRTVAWRVMDGPFGDELSELFLKQTGLRVLCWAENGFRHFTTSSRAIKTPADMKGMKIRVMESPAYIAMVKGLGANPTPITWTELYSALQQKVADGQENPINNILSGKLYEVQKNMILDGHSYGFHIWMINNKFYESLPEKYQIVIKDAGRMAVVAHRAASLMADVKGLETISKAGVQIYAPTSAELDLFKAAAQPPVEEFLKTSVKGPWLEKLKKNVADIEASMAKVP